MSDSWVKRHRYRSMKSWNVPNCTLSLPSSLTRSSTIVRREKLCSSDSELPPPRPESFRSIWKLAHTRITPLSIAGQVQQRLRHSSFVELYVSNIEIQGCIVYWDVEGMMWVALLRPYYRWRRPDGGMNVTIFCTELVWNILSFGSAFNWKGLVLLQHPNRSSDALLPILFSLNFVCGSDSGCVLFSLETPREMVHQL